MPRDGQAGERLKSKRYPASAARFWHGMPADVWLPLLWHYGRTIRPRAIGLAATVTFASFVNTTMRAVQRLVLDRKVAGTKLVDGPVFIVGHWRSGTTLLHELLVLDERFTCPTTYECFAPNHFLVTAWWAPLLQFLLPAQRPMDDMLMGWTRPQEDEFALCNMGIPSPYLHIAFPNDRERYLDYLDFAGVPAADLERWKAALHSFLQQVTYHASKRLVLKSPPHLGRIRVLLEMFPSARFVHIVRDPCDVYSSTANLWKTLYESQAFQKPRDEGFDEFIFTCFERLYGQFEQDREHLSPGQLCDVRYEDLVRDPIGQVQMVYDRLDLGDFGAVQPKLAAYFEKARDYRPNQHSVDPELRGKIQDRWGRYMRRYGYCLEPAVATSSGGG